MNAKKMFEKIGYLLESKENDEIIYYNPSENKKVVFVDKAFRYFVVNYKGKGMDEMLFRIPLFKAISKQIEELGW